MSLHITDYITIDQLPAECIRDCTTPGQDASPSARYWRETLGLTVDRDRAIQCIQGYGGWTHEEITAKGDEELAEIILWLACGDFHEWDGTEDSPAGSDIFSLE